MKYFVFNSILFGLTIFYSSCKKENQDQQKQEPVVIKATGNIQDDVNGFRHLLGDQLNVTTGVIGGRREINWDAVPDSLIGKRLPANFFNPVGATAPVARQKGLVYSTGAEFRVSNINFTDINANGAGQFSAFSGSN